MNFKIKTLISSSFVLALAGCSSLDQNQYLTQNGNEVVFSQFSPSSSLSCEEVKETKYYRVPKIKAGLFEDEDQLDYDQYVENAKKFSETAHNYDANYIEVTTIEKLSPSMDIATKEEVGLLFNSRSTTLTIEMTPRFMKANYYKCDNL